MVVVGICIAVVLAQGTYGHTYYEYLLLRLLGMTLCELARTPTVCPASTAATMACAAAKVFPVPGQGRGEGLGQGLRVRGRGRVRGRVRGRGRVKG